MRARRPLARAAALVLLLTAAPLAAGAADAPDPAALEAQVRDWLAGLLGPDVALGERPVRLAPEGDHLALTVPVPGPLGQGGVALEGPPFTARLRRLEGGRWALEDGRLPSPLRVTAPGGRDWTVTFADQTQRAVLDPTLATASTWDGRAGRYATASHGPGGARTTEATNLQTHVVWQPSGAGRVDVRETASSDLIASNAHLPHAGVASFSAGHSEMSAHIDGLSPARVAPVLQAVLRLAPLLGQGAAEGAAAAAGDAAVAISLAGSLFFDISPQAARGKIALYLLLTMLPFAVVAPLLGPALDRMQGGRRLMVVISCAGRAVVAAFLVVNIS
ncbi:MAG TPA: hypothetical protein VFN46_02575, partial [Acetobacteraceae bacterium]|nr:hypothetical protein [Acetobacteraceae bacterium]